MVLENNYYGLYNLNDPNPATGIWTRAPIVTAPGIFDGPGFLFDVAANAAGDSSTDILFVGSRSLWRSTDAGNNWDFVNQYYADHHAIGFEERPAAIAVLVGPGANDQTQIPHDASLYCYTD